VKKTPQPIICHAHVPVSCPLVNAHHRENIKCVTKQVKKDENGNMPDQVVLQAANNVKESS
jgi:hypothetical protein